LDAETFTNCFDLKNNTIDAGVLKKARMMLELFMVSPSPPSPPSLSSP
jgi:hypothetical protein